MGLLYELAEGVYGFMMSGPPFPADLLYIAIALVPVILIHELGHALEAHERLGVDVHIEVGNTGRLVCAIALSFVPDTGVLHDLLWAMALAGSSASST